MVQIQTALAAAAR